MKISTLDNLSTGTDRIFYDDIYSSIPPDKPNPKVPPTKSKSREIQQVSHWRSPTSTFEL